MESEPAGFPESGGVASRHDVWIPEPLSKKTQIVKNIFENAQLHGSGCVLSVQGSRDSNCCSAN
jgi:hypothetical protein